ncbi:MAG: SCO family protein [Sulfuricurvum sp.]|jgi:protein SCO1/2|nr:SCO family protein [Sulfuricurvum sp.]
MNKKITLAVVFFIFLGILLPLLFSLLFSNQRSSTIVIDQRIQAPYLRHTSKDWILVYFGYVGCVKVCTPILQNLDNFYDSQSFESLKESVGFVFINLMPEVERSQPDAFAKSFNPKFEGFYLTQKELMSIDREFNVFFSKSLRDVTEINHSDYVYLVQRKQNGDLILKNIYATHPLNRELIITDIDRLQKETK